MQRVEVFADVWCPFAHVGLRAMAGRLRERQRDDVVLWVRAWPLELVNGRPQDPTKTAEHIRDLQAMCEPQLFSGFDPERFPTTSRPALALAAAAYRQDPWVGQAVSFSLRTALFEEGRDIGDPEVLADIAAKERSPRATPDDDAQVVADWHEGQGRGVKGSPHFFLGSLDVFCPYLDMERDGEGHLHIDENVAALDRFLDAGLAST